MIDQHQEAMLHKAIEQLFYFDKIITREEYDVCRGIFDKIADQRKRAFLKSIGVEDE